MKWKPIVFLLFLIPALVYGFDQKGATRVRDQALSEWKHHGELLEEFKSFGADEHGYGLQRLRESLECCQRALSPRFYFK